MLASLPADARRQAWAAYRQFLSDPSHRGLQFKRVAGLPDVYSARVGLHYRALGVRHGDEVTWFWIGTHAEYDQVLRRR